MASSLSQRESAHRREETWPLQSTPPRRGSRRISSPIGIGVRLVRNVDIIKVMKAAGFDWLFLDLEHGAMSIETACEISTAAQDSGIAPIVRVPYGELAMATRVLDGGALGIVDPACRHRRGGTRDRRQAALSRRSAIARWAAVRRSSTMRPCKIGRHDQAQLNDNTLITVMIETPKAVRERRGDRRRARHRLPCWWARATSRWRWASPARTGQSQDPGGRRQGRRRLQEAPQVPGHGRRLQRRAAAALHRRRA